GAGGAAFSSTPPTSASSGTPGIGLPSPLELLAQVVAAVSQLAVVAHDHVRALVAKDLGSLRDAGAGLRQVGADGVAVQVCDEVAAEVEFLADAAEAAAHGVAVPGPAVGVAEQRPVGVQGH